MKKYILMLTEMSPNGTNDAIVFDSDTLEAIDVIEGLTFGYPTRTNIRPDHAWTFEHLSDASDLDDTELVEAGVTVGLYSVTLEKALSIIAVSPACDGSSKVKQLMKYFNLK